VKERMELKGRDLLTLIDFSSDEIWEFFKEATRLEKLAGKTLDILQGKSILMFFQRPSTRTRISFNLAIAQLGGHPIMLGVDEMQLRRGETLADTARTLERYVDGIVARVVSHQDVKELAEHTAIPVINALSPQFHPCQALSDLYTIYKRKGTLKDLKVAWIGDGDNVCHSLLIGCAKLGVDMSVASPPSFEPNVELVKLAKREGSNTGAKIKITHEPMVAAKDADVIYTDTFVSMGKEDENEKRRQIFLPKYQVTGQTFKNANDGCLFMHCLPAHRGAEVVEEIIDGPNSIVWLQAENKLHIGRAILSLLI
jgi:ornithine carbamoyltransferase